MCGMVTAPFTAIQTTRAKHGQDAHEESRAFHWDKAGRFLLSLNALRATAWLTGSPCRSFHMFHQTARSNSLDLCLAWNDLSSQRARQEEGLAKRDGRPSELHDKTW